MKTFIYKSFSVLLCLCLLFATAGCSEEEPKPETDEIETLSTGSDFIALGTSQGMELVAENDAYRLLLDPDTATVAVYVKSSGYLWKSNLDPETASSITNEDVMYEYMSQLLISYYNSSNSEIIYDSYRYAVLENNEYNQSVKYYALDNGLRTVYKIGQSINYFYMPAVLTQEYFDELTSQMSEEDALVFGSYYETLVYEEISPELIDSYKLSYKNFAPGDTYYQLATNSRMVKERCYTEYLQELGVDDAYIDTIYTAAGYSYTKPDVPQFTVAVDFTLTPQGLTVNVPMDLVQFDKSSFRLHSIQVLPFFGAVQSGEAADMLLPDGSGALIDGQLYSTASISLPFYGADQSLWTTETAQNMQQATLPVYGISKGKNAFVAYVSDGESVGSVECHPKNSVYPFAYIGGTYTIHPYETYASNGASSQATMQKYASDPYEGNITINYMFLAGDQVDYTDMAKTVRSYLFSDRSKITDDTVKFYFETYGIVLRKENFLGYSYNKTKPLTTFEQAQAMYDTLNENGITNITVRYNNWYNDAYVNKIANIGKVSGAIGGSGGMEDFMAYVTEKGGTVYANAELVLEKYSTSLFNATWHSKFIEGTMVKHANSNLYSEGITADFERLVVKSDVIVEKLPGILKKTNQLGINNLALSTVGEQMFSDFTEDKVRYRDAVQDDMVTIMQQVKENGRLMVDTGNAYTLPYADDIMGVSLGCSNLSFEKTEVPFLQIVLHGFVSYSGDSMNLSDDYDMQLLKSAEYGANLAYTLNYADAEMVKNTNYSELYSTNFEHWKDAAIAEYQRVAAVLDGCQSSTIEDHKQLAADVYMTVYENGAAVVVNYSDKAYTYNNTTIDAKNFARVQVVAKEG